MGKNNRKRRAEKKGKKKLRKNTKPKTQKNNSEGPVFTKLNNPFDGLTNEERTRALAEIAKNAEEQYSKSLEKIRETIRTYDPFVLISILSGYGLNAPIGDGGVKKRDSEYHIHQYHLEFLQALILQTDEANLGKSAFGPDVVQEMWDTLPGLMDAHAFRGINKIDENASEDEKSISMLQHSIRSNTKAVRNWGYFSQVRTIYRELYSRLNDLLIQLEGFNADQLITIFEVIVDCIENKHSDRFRTLKSLYNLDSNREVVNAYYDLIGEERSEADRFIHEFDLENTDKKSMFSILMSHYDLRSDETYTFSVDEVLQKSGIERDVIDRVLQYFSHAKGELAETETEYLYLSNPVWSKPLVKLGSGSYFCSIPQVFFSFIMPSIEGIFGNEYKDRVSNTRASYLEDKVAEIIERRFPEANTVRGLTWNCDGAEYETDIVTCIDSHILILEVKSGIITEPALRGAPGRLKRHIKEILVDPNNQSKRLKNRLLELMADPSIKDDLREKLPVNLEGVHKIIRVSVSLDDFAMIQANVSQLKETGWLPNDFEVCPTMNLADFETLFDFLEHPVQILHYLECRQELESRIGFIGCELDLMGFYIETLFNIGDADESFKYILAEASAPLDSYYNSKDAGVIIDKPAPRISSMFSEVFKQLESRKTPRWTEIGVLLNRFSPDDQKKVERMAEKLKKNIDRNWYKKGHKNMVIYVPPKESGYSLCIVLFKNDNADLRNDFIDVGAEHALKASHVKQCLIIAKNVDDDSMAYHFIGLAQ